MSDQKVIDITQLAGRFKNRKELQDYAEKLFHALKDAVEKIQKLQEENAHLKELLDKTIPQLPQQTIPVALQVPDEQAIAEIQLKKLKDAAQQRELTLDEVKRFDILTKNLYLSKGKPTGVLKTTGKKLEEEMTEAELVELIKKDNE